MAIVSRIPHEWCVVAPRFFGAWLAGRRWTRLVRPALRSARLEPMPTRILSLSEPLDLGRTLGIHLRGSGDPTMRMAPGHVVRATRTIDGPATIELRQEGSRISATAWGPGADRILDALPSLVGLDDDRGGFEPGR